jgi:oxygen-independent coproporphyrinogen-3 oxidase
VSGIYIHIPFCRKACHYCNFHFSTNLAYIDELTEAICKDIDLRNNFLENRTLHSIYFGGGTPSLLNENQIKKILSTISRHFELSTHAEITYECNPDDLNIEYLNILKNNGINRLSIGVQSFFNEDLDYMNRSHNAYQSIASIESAQKIGFENITIDLIYGSPTTSDQMWQKNIQIALSHNIPHISSYCLTIEEKTVFHHWANTGKMSAIDEEKASQQFHYLIESLTNANYDHYEISNFGKPGFHALHNTNYWKGSYYLGVGPSAHSYNGRIRTWVKSNNIQYINSLSANEVPVQLEELSISDKYNEYIMTSLRTMWGVDKEKIKNDFGESYIIHFNKVLKNSWLEDKLIYEDSNVKLTQNGKLYADKIASDFFWVE